MWEKIVLCCHWQHYTLYTDMAFGRKAWFLVPRYTLYVCSLCFSNSNPLAGPVRSQSSDCSWLGIQRQTDKPSFSGMSTDFNEDLIIRLNQLRGNESFILDLLSSLNSSEQVSQVLVMITSSSVFAVRV